MNIKRNCVAIACLLCFFTTTLQSQDCKFTCQDLINVALDSNCTFQVGPTDVLSDTFNCVNLEIHVFDHYNVEVPNALLTKEHRGKTYTYKVLDETGNSCWGYIVPEDKYATIISCEDDTLNCWDAEVFINATPDEDNCGYDLQFEELHRTWVDFECEDPDLVGYIQRSVVSIDVWGNVSRCDSQRVYIIREYLEDIVCPEEQVEIECCFWKLDAAGNPITVLWDPRYVYEDADGYSHPIPMKGGLVEPPYFDYPEGRHYVGSNVNSEGEVNNGKCNIISEYKDHIIPTCGASYKIRREWKIFDWCTGEDTLCVQWIKITDTIAPVIFFGPEFTPVIVAYTKPHDCLAHVELGWPTIYSDCSIKAAKGDLVKAFKDFKVRYQMEWVDPGHPGKVIVRTGEIPYGEKVIEYVPKTGLLFVEPDIKVRYTVTDGCWNESRICQTLLVYDNTPPTPVCDELTQVTLDPDSCWVRIYAEDMDDGSNDNCDDVHFAIALQSDVDYWTNYWHENLNDCYLKYHYAADVINSMIEEWIDLYVFDSYIDLYECGRDDVVLRVYEDLGTPPYDPHKFKGSEHDWYNWYRAPILRFSSYRCNYVFYYDSIGGYHDQIYPDLTCEEIEFAIFREEIENGLVGILDALNRFDFEEIAEILGVPGGMGINEFIQLILSTECKNPFIDSDGNDFLEAISCFDIGDLIDGQSIADFEVGIEEIDVVNAILGLYAQNPMVTSLELGGGSIDGLFDLTLFGPDEMQALPGTAEASALEVLNVFYYLICYGSDVDMKIKVFQNLATYPELLSFVTEERNLVNLAYSGVWRKRFLDLPYYNDCWIEIIKDDKTPPVCIPPANEEYYCDGVPVNGSIFPNGGNDKISWTSAQFAHDICEKSDFFLAGCEFDRTDDGADMYGTPGTWCVDGPWDGGVHGYYGGPIDDSYSYDDPCDENLEAWLPEFSYTWKPIYCRFWLMLDKYDIEGDGKPDAYAYFGEPEIYDNCWYPEIEEVTEGELDECGVGYLTRTWTVTDKCGNTASCHQTITLRPRSDFEVKFPADIEVTCDALEDLSPIEDDPATYPIVTDDDCELIGISYSDQVIDTKQDGCYKILRTWKVIDWCLYSPDIHNRYADVIVDDRCVADSTHRPCVIRNLKDDGDGFVTYLQVLRIVDDVAPVVTCNPDYVKCIYDDNCDAAEVIYELGIAEDNCTKELQYRYIVKPDMTEDEGEWIFGHGNIVQNELPVGIHTAVLYAKDDCGNEDSCSLKIEVKDCKLPTPYCHDGIVTVVMPSTGEVTVWAKDLDAGSFDNCTPKDSLKFSFTDVDYIPSKTITCADLPGGDQIEVEVMIWVKDQAGNQDFCITKILVQDGSADACPDISLVETEENDKKTSVELTKNKPESVNQFTESNTSSLIRNNDISLMQNRPNPFNESTIIEFEISESQRLQLQIVDIAGKVIQKQNGVYSKGLNQWIVRKEDLNTSSGILYYQLITDDAIVTKRMILIE